MAGAGRHVFHDRDVEHLLLVETDGEATVVEIGSDAAIRRYHLLC